MEYLKKLLHSLINICFYLCLLTLAWVVIQVFCYTTFRIPTDSMEPSILPGDVILVNKMTAGARLFDVFASLEKEDVKIYRTPGVGSFKRNDVLVFNFPYPTHWDSIGFDVMKYYVKRCIALPGDTVEIRNGFFKIRGVEEEVGDKKAQCLISGLSDSLSGYVVMKAFSQSKEIDWTIKEYGPLPVPKKGDIICLDPYVCELYSQLVSWEQKQKLRHDGETVLLGDSIIQLYQFTENYYFMAGDKLDNSQDSRYWGLLPEDYIVGRADFILYSKNKPSGTINWKRTMSKIE